jgi:hypothetical protein
MALTGTLKDFGIADILQLIGQQQKTGVLYLKSKKKEVQVQFKDGQIVSVSISKRKRRELIGEMLVRAELLNQQQLERALEAQQRTLQRLGDILVDERLVTRQRFEQIVQLQATETLYELFTWKSGTYEFEQREVQVEPDAMKPMRPEGMLMEAFRRLDEWPSVRKLVPSGHMRFERAKVELDSSEALGEAERMLFSLVDTAQDVDKLSEVTCLGEFETRRALANLLQGGYIRPREGGEMSSDSRAGGTLSERWSGNLGRLAVSAAAFAAFLLVASQVQWPRVGWSTSPISTVTDHAIERFVSGAQLGRIEAALEVYQLEKGQFPETLDSLVEVGLLRPGDLRYPWHEAYYYRRVSNREFILLPPLR